MINAFLEFHYGENLKRSLYLELRVPSLGRQILYPVLIIDDCLDTILHLADSMQAGFREHLRSFGSIVVFIMGLWCGQISYCIFLCVFLVLVDVSPFTSSAAHDMCDKSTLVSPFYLQLLIILM